MNTMMTDTFDVETDFARQFDLPYTDCASEGKTAHLRKVCNNIYYILTQDMFNFAYVINSKCNKSYLPGV